jgi:Caspase recruitment domain
LLFCVVYNGQYGSDWPLPAYMKTALKENYHDVIELLCIDDKLIEALISKECLTLTQLESLTGSPVERGVRLLDMIKRSSIATYNRFVQCVELEQPNLAMLLTGQAGKDLSNDFTYMTILSSNDLF